MAIQETLNKPIGPLKLWHWVVVIVGAYLLYHFFFKSSSGIGGAGLVSDTGSAPGDINPVPTTIANTPTGGGAGTATGSGGDTSGGTNPTASILDVGGAGLSPDVQQYWNDKLGNLGVGTVVDSYDAATNLAHWLQIQATGRFLPSASGAGLTFDPSQQGAPINAQDLQIGLANAYARARAAGISDADLAAAQASLQTQLQGGNYALGNPGLNDPQANALVIANRDLLAKLGNKTPVYTVEQLNAGNAAGGWTPQNIADWTSLGKIPAPSTTDESSARIRTLQTAISSQEAALARLKAAGKTGSPAYQTDYATLTKQKKELASYTIPVGTPSGH